MSDESVRAWALALAQREGGLFEAARSNYCRKATPKRLHELRTAGRRLRCLYGDLRGVLPRIHERRLHRLVERSGEARDATVLRAILKSALDESERAIIAPALKNLRDRERTGLHRMRRSMQHSKAL